MSLIATTSMVGWFKKSEINFYQLPKPFMAILIIDINV
jgi:hypothetical protein